MTSDLKPEEFKAFVNSLSPDELYLEDNAVKLAKIAMGSEIWSIHPKLQDPNSFIRRLIVETYSQALKSNDPRLIPEERRRRKEDVAQISASMLIAIGALEREANQPSQPSASDMNTD